MFYKYSDLLNIYGSRRKTDKQIAAGKYHKVSKGIYTDDADFFKLYPFEYLSIIYTNITITLQSAIEYYGLSDYIPDKYYIATIDNSSPIKNESIFQTYMKKDFFYIGREKVETESGFFYIYNKERLLVEIIRHKNKLPKDYYKEVINNYRELALKRELNLLNLVKYLSQITYGDGFLQQIEEVIL